MTSLISIAYLETLGSSLNYKQASILGSRNISSESKPSTGSFGSHCTKWADDQHKSSVPLLKPYYKKDLVSSPVWWEAETNIALRPSSGALCRTLSPHRTNSINHEQVLVLSNSKYSLLHIKKAKGCIGWNINITMKMKRIVQIR